MKKEKTLKIGQPVWFFDAYDTLHEGTIISNIPLDKTNGVPYLEIREGRYGVMNARTDSCFPSKQECLDAHRADFERQVSEYKAGISSVEDLIAFMYDNQLSGELFDEAARAAARERAKELLGMDLDA